MNKEYKLIITDTIGFTLWFKSYIGKTNDTNILECSLVKKVLENNDYRKKTATSRKFYTTH